MPPSRCGLASFSADLSAAVGGALPEAHLLEVAMLQRGEAACGAGAAADAGRFLFLDPEDADGYGRAAAALNRADAELLCLQHEYGIFGGADGEMVLDLLHRARARVVATLHTVLDAPSPNQRRVMDAIVSRADRLVVMTEHSASLMRRVHPHAAPKLRVIPHGIPDRVQPDRNAGRVLLGSGDRPTLLTFGLLSPGKGIEHAVAALPAIVRAVPDALYVVLGVTHPELQRREGERYRDGLRVLADRLGVGAHLRLVDRYADPEELASALAAADLYLTPYLGEQQSVSGTLAYSYGLGNAVISTPYRHAAELLADGRGELVPFADPGAIAAAAVALLRDPSRLAAMRERARAAGAAMGWRQVGRRYAALFAELGVAGRRVAVPEPAMAE